MQGKSVELPVWARAKTADLHAALPGAPVTKVMKEVFVAWATARHMLFEGVPDWCACVCIYVCVNVWSVADWLMVVHSARSKQHSLRSAP